MSSLSLAFIKKIKLFRTVRDPLFLVIWLWQCNSFIIRYVGKMDPSGYGIFCLKVITSRFVLDSSDT